MHQHHQTNVNGDFHVKRAEHGDMILVLNDDNYVMAEYSIRTGQASWQRFVPVTQREKVEKFLAQTCSLKAAPPTVPSAPTAKSKTKKVAAARPGRK